MFRSQNINVSAKKEAPPPPPAPVDPHVFLVKPYCQNYAWGKVGSSSVVATLMASGYPDSFRVDEASPYAEMWMGTHPSGPNTVLGVEAEKDTSLKNYVTRRPELLGDVITDHFPKNGLPFLFKVLSVQNSLSIQAHPNKELAAKLHAQQPENYPDKNHKPEMAIAITPMDALCGFRPYSEIVHFLREVPEFRLVVTEGLAEAFCQSVEHKTTTQIERFSLKAAFSSIYDREPAFVRKCVDDMLGRLRDNQGRTEHVESVYDLLEKLDAQFPGDVGIFCVFFFNRVQLKPGQAIFLAANEPHAYISGDVVECMAASDNVVRAGLTPKFKDVKTLCTMLNYEGAHAETKIFESHVGGNVTTYKPPLIDFAVQKIFLVAGSDIELPPKGSASMVLITRGEGVAYAGKKETGGITSFFVKPGVVIFVGAYQHVKLQNMERESAMILYRAYTSSHH